MKAGLRHAGACYEAEVGCRAVGTEGRSSVPQTEPVPLVCLCSAEAQRTGCVLQNTEEVAGLTAFFRAQVLFSFLVKWSLFSRSFLFLNRNLEGSELKR